MSTLTASAFLGEAAQLRTRLRRRGSAASAPRVGGAKESRIGKAPITVPKGVKVSVSPTNLLSAEARGVASIGSGLGGARRLALTPPAQGPKGKLTLQIDPLMKVDTVRGAARRGGGRAGLTRQPACCRRRTAACACAE